MTKKRAYWVIGVIVGILVIVLGYLLIQYLIDRKNYQQAHAAYQEVRCNEAIESYNALIDGWRLYDPGDFLDDAMIERTECLHFQEADDQISAGNYSAALTTHFQFLGNRGKSHLAAVSRERIGLLFGSIYPDQLASVDTCTRIDGFLDEQLIAHPELVLPPFYFFCGTLYAEAGENREAFEHHRRLLIEYPDHELSFEAEPAFLNNPISCQEIEVIAALPVLADRHDLIPKLYYNCGQAYDTEDQFEMALKMYTMLLTQYPDHPLASAAEKSLFSYEEACNYIDTLEESSEFKPRLYYQCGLYYQTNLNYAQAIQVYEQFLAEYPNHGLAEEVEAALADAIVDQVKGSNAGEIARPERSGSTDLADTIVIIQNDSPQQLRIIFSGPESRIEELSACSTCQNYNIVGPLYCPEKGPIGRYSLTPGDYDVVVEASSDSGVTPFKGSWGLRSGSEYSSCFYIVTQMFP